MLFGQRHGAVAGDPPGEAGLEVGHAGSLRVRTMSQRPSAIIGRVRIWPMVRPTDGERCAREADGVCLG
jgi:hypothetical protein